MEQKEAIRRLKNDLGRNTEVNKIGKKEYLIILPYMNYLGDNFVIYLTEQMEDSWKLSDKGLSLSEYPINNIQIDDAKLNDLLKMYRFERVQSKYIQQTDLNPKELSRYINDLTALLINLDVTLINKISLAKQTK